jgi:hypothetical protein
MGLLTVFYAPEKLFGDVSRQGKWLAPFVAVMLVAVLIQVMMVNMIGMETLTRIGIEMNPLASQIPPDKIEEQVRAANTPVRKAIQYGMGGIGMAFSILLISGVLLGLMHMSDAATSYKKVITVCSYSFFATALAGGVLTAIILASMPDYSGLDLGNLLKLNPTVFLDKSTAPKALYSLATSLDLMSFWTIFLMGLGLSKTVPKMKLSKGIMIVVIPWALYVLGKTAISAMF